MPHASKPRIAEKCSSCRTMPLWSHSPSVAMHGQRKYAAHRWRPFIAAAIVDGISFARSLPLWTNAENTS
eukprot:5044887-Prymnesium_polylepis.1